MARTTKIAKTSYPEGTILWPVTPDEQEIIHKLRLCESSGENLHLIFNEDALFGGKAIILKGRGGLLTSPPLEIAAHDAAVG